MIENSRWDALPLGIRRRFEAWSTCQATFDFDRPGRVGIVHFEDDLTAPLGADPTGTRFSAIADRMVHGRYYPVDVIEFFNPNLSRGEALKAGDRILQAARILPFVKVYSIAQLSIVERSEDRCVIGYVTTQRHFARGWWRAELTRESGELKIRVSSLAMPGSFWYWVGLPIARALQLQARKKAIESFREIA